MIKRFPHTGYLIFKKVTRNSPDDGIEGYNSEDTQKLPIKGRFELEKSTNVDYTARFFTERLDVTPFAKDDISFEYAGRVFKARFSQNQTHTEIWLN